MKKGNMAYLIVMFCIVLFLTYTIATKTYEVGIFDLMTIVLIVMIWGIYRFLIWIVKEEERIKCLGKKNKS